MRRIALLVVIAATSACQQSKAGSAAAPTVADTVAVALVKYSPAMFDTVHWASDSVRLARGADVFKWACAECHGPKGYGDGKKVTPKGDTLRPPNFHDAAWRLAGDPEGVRRKIYTGNVQGMPHWGLRHIEPRDIDAVSAYLLTVLHPAS